MAAVQHVAPSFDLRVVLPEAQRRLEHWRQVLSEESSQARQMLRTLMRGRMVFTPLEHARGVRVMGEADLGGVFEGLLDSQALASPMPASWNQIASWLKQIDNLRQAA